MGRLWVKFAAVNFDATVFDSNDLSVIRGSSALLLAIVDGVARRLAEVPGATLLYSAASECVLSFNYASSNAAVTRPRGQPHRMRPVDWRAMCAGAAERVQEVSFEEAASELHAQIAEDAKRHWSFEKTQEHLRYYWPKEEGADPAEKTHRNIEAEIEKSLGEQDVARWFTFSSASVDETELSGDAHSRTRLLRNILCILDSRLRHRQLQQWTVSPFMPGNTACTADDAFCQFTLKRQPASGKQDNRLISQSAAARRRDGRDIKKELYLREVDLALASLDPQNSGSERKRLEQAKQALEFQGLALARSFEDIVDDPPKVLPPNVRNKLAVIYFDGNGFGNKREKAAVGKLDDAVRHYARLSRVLTVNGGLMLADLLNWMLEREAGWAWRERSKGRELRFETLMFGGDEVCLVCPAWLGWSLVGELLRIFDGMRAPFSPGDASKGQSVTFAVGMAYAHHKSPIRDLRNLASSLSEAAKCADKERSMMQVMALEGLDQAEMDPYKIRKRLFTSELAGSDMGAFSFDGGRWDEITDTFRAISKDIGRSQLHRFYMEAESFRVTDPDGGPGQLCNILKLPKGNSSTALWVDHVKKRLSDFPGAARHSPIFDGRNDLLAHGAGQWPFIPLQHVLSFTDYVIDVPAGKSDAAMIEEDAA